MEHCSEECRQDRSQCDHWSALIRAGSMVARWGISMGMNVVLVMMALSAKVALLTLARLNGGK